MSAVGPDAYVREGGCWWCPTCTFRNNLLLSKCEMCETPFENAPSLSGDLNELACKIAAHGEHEEAFPVVANLVDRMARQELDVSHLEFEHFPRVASFFKRILEILHSRPREAMPKLLFDDRVGAFLRSEEPQLFAYAVTEARSQYWPVVTEFCIPYVTNFDWVISKSLYRLKDGERDVLALLRSLDATSARVLSEIIYFVLNPDQLSAPPMSAPFIQTYTVAALMSSDVRGLELLLDAGVPVDLRVTISKAVMNAVSDTVVALFLRHGADPNTAGPEGISPLHFVAATGDMALARMLVDAGARADAVLPDTDITPAVMAASNDKMDVAVFLESKCAKTVSPAPSLSSLSLSTVPVSPAPPYTHTPPLLGLAGAPPPYGASPCPSAWSSKEDLFSSSSSSSPLRPGFDFSGCMLPQAGHDRHANKFASSLALQRSTLAPMPVVPPPRVPPADQSRMCSGLAQAAARLFRYAPAAPPASAQPADVAAAAAPPPVVASPPRQMSFTTTTTMTTTTTSTTVAVAEPPAQPSHFSAARLLGGRVRAAPAALCAMPVAPSPFSKSCPDLSDAAAPP